MDLARKLELTAGLIKENERWLTLLRCLYILQPEREAQLTEAAEQTKENIHQLHKELTIWTSI